LADQLQGNPIYCDVLSNELQYISNLFANRKFELGFSKGVRWDSATKFEITLKFRDGYERINFLFDKQSWLILKLVIMDISLIYVVGF